MITKNLSTLTIHQMSEEQYKREYEAGRIDENAIYLTPSEESPSQASQIGQRGTGIDSVILNDLNNIASGDYSSAHGHTTLAHGENSVIFGSGYKLSSQLAEHPQLGQLIDGNLLNLQLYVSDEDDSYQYQEGSYEGERYIVINTGNYLTADDLLGVLTNAQFIGFIIEFEHGVLIAARKENVSKLSANTIKIVDTSAGDSLSLAHFAIKEVWNGAALGNYSVSFGKENISAGYASFTQGVLNYAIGSHSVAMGNLNEVRGYAATTLGELNKVTGGSTYALAAGHNNSIDGSCGVAIGNGNQVTRENAHAEGLTTKAAGRAAFAEGTGTLAEGNYSHAMGRGTQALGRSSLAIGEYNIIDERETDSTTTRSKYAFAVGNGNSDQDRSNAFSVDWSGELKLNDTLTITNSCGDSIELRPGDIGEPSDQQYHTSRFLHLNGTEESNSGEFVSTERVAINGVITGDSYDSVVTKGFLERKLDDNKIFLKSLEQDFSWPQASKIYLLYPESTPIYGVTSNSRIIYTYGPVHNSSQWGQEAAFNADGTLIGYYNINSCELMGWADDYTASRAKVTKQKWHPLTTIVNGLMEEYAFLPQIKRYFEKIEFDNPLNTDLRYENSYIFYSIATPRVVIKQRDDEKIYFPTTKDPWFQENIRIGGTGYYDDNAAKVLSAIEVLELPTENISDSVPYILTKATLYYGSKVDPNRYVICVKSLPEEGKSCGFYQDDDGYCHTTLDFTYFSLKTKKAYGYATQGDSDWDEATPGWSPLEFLCEESQYGGIVNTPPTEDDGKHRILVEQEMYQYKFGQWVNITPVSKKELDGVESALDAIISIQNTLIGGNNV